MIIELTVLDNLNRGNYPYLFTVTISCVCLCVCVCVYKWFYAIVTYVHTLGHIALSNL